MDIFKSMWTWVIGSIASVGIFFRSVIIIKLQLPSHIALYLLGLIQKNGRALEFEKEYVAHRTPLMYSALVYLNGTVFSFSMKGADQDNDEAKGTLYCCRWHINKILPQLTTTLFDSQVKNKAGLYILNDYSAEKIGNLDVSQEVVPYLEKEKYEDLENDIIKVLNGEKKKVGGLLHGEPGNGKSYLIRYFAVKYKLPIYIFGLERRLNNRDIIKMFNNINPPGIIVFEDFDAYFDKRKSLLTKSEFTFDTIINGIDGLYSDLNGLIYFLTTNEINKIDRSLKERPSRFKYVMEIPKPSEKIRRKILNDDKFILKTKNYSLDKCLDLRDRLQFKQKI